MGEYRPSLNYGLITPAVKSLIILNVLLHILKLSATAGLHLNPDYLDTLLGMHYPMSEGFRLWQPFTHIFTHGDFRHLLFNMFSLWFAGTVVEREWGSKKFLFFYFICGLGALLLHFVLPNNLYTNVIGASGAISGVLLAYAFLFPNDIVYFEFFIPMKAKYFVLLLVIFDLIQGFRASDHIAHFAHLGGMAIGFIILLYWRQKGLLYHHGRLN